MLGSANAEMSDFRQNNFIYLGFIVLPVINCICEFLIMFLTVVNKHWHKGVHHPLGKGQPRVYTIGG